MGSKGSRRIDARAYWCAVHARATKNARHALAIDSTERVVIAIFLGLIALVLLWTLGGRSEAWSAGLGQISVTAAVFMIFPAVYGWKFLSAPAQLAAEELDRRKK